MGPATSISGFLLLCFLLSLPTRTLSWVPPRTNAWEPVQTMRVRLGLAYNYTPSLLHPELCRFISEHECEQADRNLQRHAASHRQRQRSLQQDNPNLGKVKALVLLIQFTDHTEDRTLIEKAELEDQWNNGVKRWLDENSQGAYEIEPVVVDWTLTDNTEVYYSFDAMGLQPELQQAMYPALNQLDATDGWDWSQFDVDGDGELDAVVMMHSGYDAVTPGPDCQGRDAMQRIFPHAFSTTGETWTSADGSVSLNAYAVASAFDGAFCDGARFTPGIMCHEYMHKVGLEDLYDETDNQAAKGIGAYDVMSNPYGFDNSGNPGFLSAWSRQEVEWLAPTKVEHDGFYVLPPAETSNQAFAIFLFEAGPGFNEYLLIENRQQISFDEKVWENGLIIYHIDDTADGMKNRGYPGQEGWPGNGNHYRVAVLPKDGQYDLEQNVNIGDEGDMWLPGDVLGPGMGGTVFPNTDNYQGGWVSENGITVRVVSQQLNRDMVFEVTGLKQAPEGATNLTPPPDAAAATTDPPEAVQPTAAPVTISDAPDTPQPTIVTQQPTAATPLPTVATPLPTVAVPGATEAPETPSPTVADLVTTSVPETTPPTTGPTPQPTNATLQPAAATPLPTPMPTNATLEPVPGTPDAAPTIPPHNNIFQQSNASETTQATVPTAATNAPTNVSTPTNDGPPTEPAPEPVPASQEPASVGPATAGPIPPTSVAPQPATNSSTTPAPAAGNISATPAPAAPGGLSLGATTVFAADDRLQVSGSGWSAIIRTKTVLIAASACTVVLVLC